MATNKILPPTPLNLKGTELEDNHPRYSIGTYIKLLHPEGHISGKSSNTDKIYSAETYATLLEQENEQLHLRNNQLQLRLQCLETKISTDREHQKARTELASKCSEEVKKRDKMVGEITETIIQEFQRYKQTLRQAEDEEIKVYNAFDDDSPI
ncbi:unnamed protein product [Discula destructiva]